MAAPRKPMICVHHDLRARVMIWLLLLLVPAGTARETLIQYGPPRSATTFQLQVIRAAACLRDGAPPEVVKAHKEAQLRGALQKANATGFLLFATARGGGGRRPRCADAGRDAERARAELSETLGAAVAHVQLYEYLERCGSNVQIFAYAEKLGLDDGAGDDVLEYMRYWSVLRRCCGPQMSFDYRARLLGLPRADNAKARARNDPAYDACETYNLTAVERHVLRTRVVRACGPPMAQLSHKLPFANNITVGACARYEAAVVTQRLRFNRPPADPW